MTPDALAVELAKEFIASAMPAVPAFAGIMLVPIMPPIAIEICAAPFLPSSTPSEASVIIAVTAADETDMPSVFAYCDMAASAMP